MVGHLGNSPSQFKEHEIYSLGGVFNRILTHEIVRVLKLKRISIYMYYLIYKITNLINNKIYIGKHKTLDKNDSYFGSGSLLKNAILKYGINNFKKEIVFECLSEEEMENREEEIVNEDFVARLDTYNIQIGGGGGWNHINKDEKKKKEVYKLSRKAFLEKLKDENYKKEYKQKVLNGLKLYFSANTGTFLGKKHKEESKRKIGEKTKKLIGEKNSQYNTCWITKNKINKKIKNNQLNDYLNQGWSKGRFILSSKLPI
jgi:hypothetical protein